MKKKAYANAIGYIFAFIGACIDIILAINSGNIGFPWAFVMMMIIGLVIATKIYPDFLEEEQKKLNFGNKFKYKDIYCKLPKDLIFSLQMTLANTIILYNTSSYPEEWVKLQNALTTIQNEKLYGTITFEKREKVKNLINNFSEDLRYLIPTLNKNMNAAADKGLGFGIIGGASDVALYNVMNTMEKRNNLLTENRVANRLVNSKIIELTESIQNVLL